MINFLLILKNLYLHFEHYYKLEAQREKMNFSQNKQDIKFLKKVLTS